MERLTERAIVGALVMELINNGFRVEMCDQDGGGLHVYAVPDGGQKPTDGYDYWIILVPGNGTDVISDYSVNFETILAPVFKFVETLDSL